MRRALFEGCLLLVLASACSVADERGRPAPPRPTAWTTATEVLRVAGVGRAPLEEIPVALYSVGDGEPESVPVEHAGVPAARDTKVPAPQDPQGPQRVPWSDRDEDETEATDAPRPERMGAAHTPTTGDPGTQPLRVGGNPCCSSPCGVSARSLAALMANPAMTAGAPDGTTTLAGRRAMLAANRVGASFGQASNGGGTVGSRGVFLGGRVAPTTRAK